MHTPKYCLFYDNHTMKACPDVGAGFDAKEFAERIKTCGVDYVTFHARCNQGFAYYDTDIGIKHPALGYDLFGQLVEACQKRNIAVTAYLNGGISNEEGLLHRDWTTLSFDGREYRQDRMTPYVRTMCYNSPYRDHMIAMIREIAGKYPVAGFFIDCLAPYKCICPICVSEMKESGIDWNAEEEVEKFSKFSLLRLTADIATAAKKINPDVLLYFNGPCYEKQSPHATYFECECLPTNPNWGYEFLPVLSHYMRTLGNKPVLNMTARFYDWGDFGSLRPQAAIEYDLFYGLANGMRPNIGGHFHPRGDINHAVFDRIKAVYSNLQQYEHWFDNAENVTEIAVVYPKTVEDIRFSKALRSAVRMLSELKMQFDIVTEAADWSGYQLLLLPDDVKFSEETARRVKAHIAAGKAVISSGWSGLDTEGRRFVLEEEWGTQFIKDCDYDPPYFTPEPGFEQHLPAMPMGLYLKGTEVKCRPGTQVGATVVAPYYNRHWDGERAHYYNPPHRTTELPLLTVKGKVAHFSHPVFQAYHHKATVELRQIFANVLTKLLPMPLLKCSNVPSFARVFVTSQPGRHIVHLLAWLPELRGRIETVEEALTLNNVDLALRTEAVPLAVYLAPDKIPLEFEWKNGYVHVNLAEVTGYAMTVFEFQ